MGGWGGRRLGVLGVALAAGVIAVSSLGAPAGGAARPGTARPEQKIAAVGAENQYANVISQIGGRAVRVTAIMSNPNTDPHTYEVSPGAARLVSAARLVVQNGLGYDAFMNKLEAASPSATRKVITVQRLLRLPERTRNPHLWYRPTTMPAVAKAVAADLTALDPARRASFAANLRRFDRSLRPWLADIATLRRRFGGVKVATTEPVADDLLHAAGADVATPWALQADIMNGIDPSPQAVGLEENLLSRHEVRVFVYNRQVTDSLTETFLAIARKARIPVVGVYETMPTPGFDYQAWMVAETRALLGALEHGRSTEAL